MNTEVKSIFNNNENNIGNLSIAITRPDKNQSQQHIGIFYKNSTGNIKLLHLRWHYCLSNDDFTPDYLWLDSPLDPINQVHLAAVCELIYTSNSDGIPYGIGTEGISFSATGEVIYKQKNSGLTCSTFVMKIFSDQGLAIIDTDKWKHRKSDKKWQKQILQQLENYCKTRNIVDYESYLKHQESLLSKGVSRYKPEEVAIAAFLENPPHGVGAIKSKASQLMQIIINHSKQISEQKTNLWKNSRR